MKGPVIPLPTAFKENGDIDVESMERYVSFLADSGIKNVMTTVGTSRYNLLSPDECKSINEAVVRGSDNRLKVIVANPPYGGQQSAIDFAKHSSEIGADYFLAYFPERFYGDGFLIDFFSEVSMNSDIDILIHEMPMRNGLGAGTVQYSIPLLEKLLKIDRLVGLKEEALDLEHSNKVVERFSSESIIIGAGGGMSRYLNRDFDLGASAYLGGIGNFEPSLELEFFEALNSGNLTRSKEIVETIELPYFEKVVPLGWHPSLKAALAIKGLLPSFERKPMKSLSNKEIEGLTMTLQEFGWL